MNLSHNFLTVSICIVSHFNSLVGTNTSDWLQSCEVKTMLSKQSLHSARSVLHIFHSELNVIACVVSGIAVSGLMFCLKAKELANDPRSPLDGIKTGSGAIP